MGVSIIRINHFIQFPSLSIWSSLPLSLYMEFGSQLDVTVDV